MAGSSLLLPGSSMGCSVGAGPRVGLDAFLQLLARTERDHGARGDRDLLASLGVAAGALVLAAQVEVAEAGQLDLAARFQGLAQGVEERVDEFLRLALVEPDFVEQPLGHLCFGQCHLVPLDDQVRSVALWDCSSAETTCATTTSTSRSVRVRDSSWRIKPIARLLNPDSTPGPAYRSNSTRSRNDAPAAVSTVARKAAQDTDSGTTNARSRRTDGYFDKACARAIGRDSNGARSSSKATTGTSRSSARCRRGWSWPIQPRRTSLPSGCTRNTSAERPGW